MLKIWGIITMISLSALAKTKVPATAMTVSTPFVLVGHEAGANLGFNTGVVGVWAAEFLLVGEGEEYSRQAVEEKKTSLETSGYEAAVMYARFVDQIRLSGFFWSLGAGYRYLKGVSRRVPSDRLRLTIPEQDLDEDGWTRREFLITGMTIHARLGYRYLFSWFPMFVGGYGGIRHFECHFDEKNVSTVEDREEDEEKYELKRLLTTRPVAAVELGMAF